MLKQWPPIILMIVSLIAGFVLVDYYGKTILGLLIMSASVVFIWMWALWPDIRNWFKNRIK
jgi:hypothetical protein